MTARRVALGVLAATVPFLACRQAPAAAGPDAPATGRSIAVDHLA